MTHHRHLKHVFIFCSLFSLAPALAAKTMYIDDTLYAPLRSGQGLQFRIINKGLKSGTKLEDLQDNPDSGYSLVQTQDGQQGWLPTRYLTDQPIAADRLKQVSHELDQSRSDLQQAKSELQKTQQERDGLQQDKKNLESKVADLSQQLDHLKTISSDAVNLDKRNRELQESNQQLQNKVEVLAAENDRLKGKRETDYMLVGGGLVGLGILVAVIIPWMRPTRKNDSWV